MKRNSEDKIDEVDATNHHGRPVRCRFRVTIGMSLSLGHRILVDWFDTWQWFLTLIMLYIFLSYVVRLPIFFFGAANPIYAYSWMALWIGVMALFLAWREREHTKAQMSPKWVNNPNAVAEYLYLIKKQSSKD